MRCKSYCCEFKTAYFTLGPSTGKVETPFPSHITMHWAGSSIGNRCQLGPDRWHHGIFRGHSSDSTANAQADSKINITICVEMGSRHARCGNATDTKKTDPDQTRTPVVTQLRARSDHFDSSTFT